jgi:hypothetical protein
MQIFLHRGGQQTGPFSIDEVRAQLASGAVSAADLAWYEGAADWAPVSSLPGLGLGVPLAPNPPPRYVPPAVQQGTPGVAIASLVLGLSVFLFGLLAGIPAIICGHIALSKIKQAGGMLSGKGMAITGLVLGYLSILVIPAILAAIALPVFNTVQQKAKATQSLSNAKQIALACRLYAADNDGKFPPTLQDLVPTYIQSQKIFSDPMDPTHAPIGYDYFGGKDSDPPDTVLLRSKVALHGMRVVVYSDSSGRILRENSP